MKITFSVNQYDSHGDVFDACILLHFKGGSHIIRLENMTELDEMINKLLIIKEEIKANY